MLSTDLVPVLPEVSPFAVALVDAATRVDLYSAVLSGRNAQTVRAYEGDFVDFARFLSASTAADALDALTSIPPGAANAVALSYRAHLTERGLSAATTARRLAALRSACKLAKTLGRITWTLQVEAPRTEPLRDTAGPGAGGWRAMLDVAKTEATTAKGLRDVALVRLLHDLALRRQEALGLDVSDVDLDGGTVAIVGKGQTEPVRLTLPDPVKAALAAWLAVHPDPRPTAPVFVRLDRAGKASTRLTGRAAHKLVVRLGRRAGLARHTRPHGLRHGGITEVLDRNGGDIRAAARFSRHKDLRTLARYDDNRADLAGQMARLISEE
jgi:integrase/recombinase XerC